MAANQAASGQNAERLGDRASGPESASVDHLHRDRPHSVASYNHALYNTASPHRRASSHRASSTSGDARSHFYSVASWGRVKAVLFVRNWRVRDHRERHTTVESAILTRPLPAWYTSPTPSKRIFAIDSAARWRTAPTRRIDPEGRWSGR